MRGLGAVPRLVLPDGPRGAHAHHHSSLCQLSHANEACCSCSQATGHPPPLVPAAPVHTPADEACHSHVNHELKQINPDDPNPFVLGKSQLP